MQKMSPESFLDHLAEYKKSKKIKKIKKNINIFIQDFTVPVMSGVLPNVLYL